MEPDVFLLSSFTLKQQQLYTFIIETLYKVRIYSVALASTSKSMLLINYDDQWRNSEYADVD